MTYATLTTKRLTPTLEVTAFLNTEQIHELANMGVQTLICNRPDDEEPGQPKVEELQAIAERLGLQWHHQPVISGQVTDEQGEAFGRILGQAKAPVVAFCRTGARSSMLWALQQRHYQTGEEIVAHLKSVGYDLPDFFKRLCAD